MKHNQNSNQQAKITDPKALALYLLHDKKLPPKKVQWAVSARFPRRPLKLADIEALRNGGANV
jgi:hypothetical protein